MTEPIELELKRIADRSRPADPDMEAMWSAISNRVAKSEGAGFRRRSFSLRPRKWAAPALLALCLAVAVPAFAAPALNWDWFAQRAAKSLESGDGVRIDRTITSGGYSFHLLGAVSDDYRTDLLFQLSGSDLFSFDYVAFGSAELTDGRGGLLRLSDHMTAEEGGTLNGLLEANAPMERGMRNYSLNVKDLILYKEVSVPVDLRAMGPNGQTAKVDDEEVAEATIESIVRTGGVYTVRYRLAAASARINAALNPRLILRSDGLPMNPTRSTLLPPPGDNSVLMEETYELSDAQLASAEFALSRLAESRRINAEWNFSFQADGQKAEQAIYRRKLDSRSVANAAGADFKELVVTPLEIRLTYEEPVRSFKDYPYLDYEQATLLLNGKEIEGGMFMNGNGRDRYYRFLSPEWYRDWSDVPMQVRLRSLKVQAKASPDQLLELAGPTDAKRTIETEVGGFPVAFTYYKDGADLIVESNWRSETEGGITQTYIAAGDKRLLAEYVPEAPGGNGTRRKVERYRNVPQGELKLNPFLYHWTDKEKTETLTVN